MRPPICCQVAQPRAPKVLMYGLVLLKSIKASRRLVDMLFRRVDGKGTGRSRIVREPLIFAGFHLSVTIGLTAHKAKQMPKRSGIEGVSSVTTLGGAIFRRNLTLASSSISLSLKAETVAPYGFSFPIRFHFQSHVSTNCFKLTDITTTTAGEAVLEKQSSYVPNNSSPCSQAHSSELTDAIPRVELATGSHWIF